MRAIRPDAGGLDHWRGWHQARAGVGGLRRRGWSVSTPPTTPRAPGSRPPPSSRSSGSGSCSCCRGTVPPVMVNVGLRRDRSRRAREVHRRPQRRRGRSATSSTPAPATARRLGCASARSASSTCWRRRPVIARTALEVHPAVGRDPIYAGIVVRQQQSIAMSTSRPPRCTDSRPPGLVRRDDLLRGALDREPSRGFAAAS